MEDPFIVEQVELIRLPLVNRFYKASRYSAKAGRGEKVYVLKQGPRIVAALRLVPKPNGYYFLRSMCVDPALRGQGLGTRLLQGIAQELAEFPCYCYPFEHLELFYGQIGFRRVDEGSVPDFIQDGFTRLLSSGRGVMLMMREPG